MYSETEVCFLFLVFQWRKTMFKNKNACAKNASIFRPGCLQPRPNVRKKERWEFCISKFSISSRICVSSFGVCPFPCSSQEKLILREQLWQSEAELQQQADFCTGLGSATCCLLWSSSARENTVTHWLADVSHLDTSACISIDYTVFSRSLFSSHSVHL